MTLELSQVSAQIAEMAQVLAERAGRQFRALPKASDLLASFAEDLDELCRVAESAAGRRLRCAIPAGEPLNVGLPAPAMPAGATLIAADGSQIYPDRHGMAFYYLINVGSIVLRHGSGQAPRVSTLPHLCYAEEKIYPGGDLVSADLVNVERSVAEMAALTGLILAESECDPACLGLTDGPLLLWLGQTAVPKQEQTRLRSAYMDCLHRLRGRSAIVAGFVSRPQSAEVLTLLYLRNEPADKRDAAKELSETQYRGLADRHLFGFLQRGQRSAVLTRGTPENQQYQAEGHAIRFFYVNTGSDIARVEIPEWVAARSDALDLVHAAVIDQCSFNNGYPYILTRADELAFIQGEEREALERMLVQAMLRQGLDLPELSRKAQQKQAARWRR